MHISYEYISKLANSACPTKVGHHGDWFLANFYSRLKRDQND